MPSNGVETTAAPEQKSRRMPKKGIVAAIVAAVITGGGGSSYALLSRAEAVADARAIARTDEKLKSHDQELTDIKGDLGDLKNDIKDVVTAVGAMALDMAVVKDRLGVRAGAPTPSPMPLPVSPRPARLARPAGPHDEGKHDGGAE